MCEFRGHGEGQFIFVDVVGRIHPGFGGSRGGHNKGDDLLFPPIDKLEVQAQYRNENYGVEELQLLCAFMVVPRCTISKVLYTLIFTFTFNSTW